MIQTASPYGEGRPWVQAEVERILAGFGGDGDPSRLDQLASSLEATLDTYHAGPTVGRQVVRALRRRAMALRS